MPCRQVDTRWRASAKIDDTPGKAQSDRTVRGRRVAACALARGGPAAGGALYGGSAAQRNDAMCQTRVMTALQGWRTLSNRSAGSLEGVEKRGIRATARFEDI